MNSVHKSVRQKAASLIGIGCLIGFVVASCVPPIVIGTAEASPQPVQQSLQPKKPATATNVILDYVYETTPNSTAGNRSLEVDSIHFHPNYVVVEASNGITSVFAVERLRQFSYTSK